ncbi:MAG: TlpA family protein disulfide reductase [Gammaproteobacteria bacterium]|nr:TlpA family protein disulfide reductase [Gammaproteobacteria bacterium]
MASETLFFKTSDETEIEYNVYKAKGDTLFIWLYSEAGPQAIEDKIAQQLTRLNIEVWRPDLFAAHFLPIANSSMDLIPGTDISELIDYAHKQTGKRIIAVTTGRGALPVLTGANLWQTKNTNSNVFSGVILMSPKFYFESPDPGEEAQLLDIVNYTNLAMFIIQPQKSPWYWKLDHTIPALEKNGSDVFVQRLKNVRDRYYFRADADAYEQKQTTKLPESLKNAASYLNALPYKKRKVSKMSTASKSVIIGKKERKLQPYKGNPVPPMLILDNLEHKQVDLRQLKGQVVLVNFWASWCPPCVHEMPSMQRLQNRFSAKDFSILGVNMAEDEKTVRKFLATKVSINFPVVFDRDGAALKRWGVFAFPTSYIIDKKGHIRYAILGGVEWDTEAIVKKIKNLINE